MRRPSVTVIATGIFVAYIAHSMWTIYGLFYPAPCLPDGQCIYSYLARNPQLKLWVYTSQKEQIKSESGLRLVWDLSPFTAATELEKTVNVSIPKKTRENGTLHVHIFVALEAKSPFATEWNVYGRSSLTTFAIPRAETFQLIGGSNEPAEGKGRPEAKQERPVSHFKSRLTVSIMDEEIAFDRRNIPGEIYRYMRLTPSEEYLPLLYVDELSSRIKDLVLITENSTRLPLTVVYKPISVGKLRLWINMQEAMKNLHALGFSDKDTDEMKGIFADTNFYFLMMTFGVAALHLLFDFLAFKNDISYWKHRNTMVGLSTRTVVWRSVSTIIIFFYLMDEETSLLVLIPAGIATIIEMWKVKKAFKVQVHWSGVIPKFKLGTTTDKEQETRAFDSQAMKYLSYLLYPLCLGGAVYSLLYTPHKSWYSWTVKCLVNGVYAFGFLFMLPQLFVNYKLKSVAHLPWRAFMYKAFNTFIDDVFAFIITMPTAHRLACFRDDLVFLVYLYQKWLYPVDKTRVNEYGQTFEEDKKQEPAESKKTQ